MSLKLQRSALPGNIGPGQHTWPLKVVATSTTDGLPSDIFVYHAGQSGAITPGDEFWCVASVHQLNELGLAPVAGGAGKPAIPLYRSATLLFDCRSAEEAEELWQTIQQEGEELVINFNARLQLVETDSITIP